MSPRTKRPAGTGHGAALSRARSGRRPTLGLVSLVVALACAADAGAQAQAAPRVKTELDSTFNANFDGVSVDSALRAIANLAHVAFDYEGTIVLPLQKRVTLHAPRITVGAALDSVFRGTRLKASLVDDGDILLTAPDLKRPSRTHP